MIVSSTVTTKSLPDAPATPERVDNLAARIRLEFLQELNDRLEEIAKIIAQLTSHRLDITQGIDDIYRNLIAIQSGSRSTNITAVETLAHCFLNYLQDLSTLTPRQLNELGDYHRAFHKVMSQGRPLDENDLRTLVRSLPPRWAFEVSDIIPNENIQILLVGNDRTSTMIIERELMACGYRSLTVTKSSEALEMVLRTKPDMVICTAVLDLLTGVDMACALSVMPSTRTLPVALLTTYAADDPQFSGLPPSVAIISKGERFGDDLARALSRFGIT